MSLATRLSAFFLTTLALVLIGFSGTLYLLARTYLIRQEHDRLELALDTLEASVDIEPGGLEWEPSDRQLTLGMDESIGSVRWTVRDGAGAIVNRSPNAHSVNFPADWLPKRWPPDRSDATVFGSVPGWQLAGRQLRLEELLRQGRGHPDDEPGYEVQFPILVLVVGLSPAPVEATLSRLGFALVALSGGLWTIAAVLGRWTSRRALGPVSRMAQEAAAMTAADLGRRLAVPGTGDELDTLGRAFNDLLVRLYGAFSQLQTAYERQSRFAGDASHQLRTPLTALLSQVQVALRHDRSPEEYRRVLQLVRVEGDRLRQIVESLLALTRPEAPPADLRDVDLTTWLPEQLRRWSDHPRAADFRVRVEDDVSPTVRVPPALLAQVLDNLLDNACKYSEPGTEVLIEIGHEAGTAVLSVTDRGFGLEDDDLARVFEPFFRSERARLEGQAGFGLGLAVARRIADSFGGSIVARSEPGTGSRFSNSHPRSDIGGIPARIARAGRGFGRDPPRTARVRRTASDRRPRTPVVLDAISIKRSKDAGRRRIEARKPIRSAQWAWSFEEGESERAIVRRKALGIKAFHQSHDDL